MKIEVVANNSQIREIFNREKTKCVARKQEIYAEMGNAYPEKAFIRIDEPLQPGKYVIAFKYRTNKFGDMEINPFESPAIKAA